MNKRIVYLLTVLCLTVVSATKAFAEDNGINTPFSRYGIGLLSNQAQGFNQGMAGVSYGMRDGRELNFKNPASYSAIDSLSFLFDIGMSLQNGNFDSGKASINKKNASFDYVSMGFRINRGFGMSIGVMPISNIGYSISSTGTAQDGGITGDITPTISYAGSGGLREIYGGLGYAPIKEISLGFNAGYAWGCMTHSATNSFTDSNVQSLNRYYYSDVRTYNLDFGLQWDQKINKKNRFILGLTYGLGHDISGKSYFFNQRIGSSTVLAADTITVENAWSLPHTFGGGLTWQYKNLRIGLDYSYQKWSQAKQPTLSTDASGVVHYEPSSNGYVDTHKITAGIEYVKDPNGLNWRSRVRYRAGFSYGDYYAKIGGEDGPKSYLATVGVGLPVITLHSNRTFINAAVQLERTKPTVSNQLTETYIRFCLGITFNERWFMKWKVQ